MRHPLPKDDVGADELRELYEGSGMSADEFRQLLASEGRSAAEVDEIMRPITTAKPESPGGTTDLERDRPEGRRPGFDGLVLVAGHGSGTMRPTRATARPILWRPGPGAWPAWCALLDSRGGAVACTPPAQAEPGDYSLNVTAVRLDPVDGLSQQVFPAEVTVLNRR